MEYVIDGARIDSLESFYDEISRVLIPGLEWGRNLDAVVDVLRGGLGALPRKFTLRWLNSGVSRANLGYAETALQLEQWLAYTHPSNRENVRRELARARSHEGPTVFDRLVEIIEARDNVRLILD